VLAALQAVDLSAVEADNATEKGAGSLDSMAGGVFVGRQREMDQLKSTFEEMLSGRGRMVTLVGEPGIGKTRTAQELSTYAGMRGATVLWGRSYESGGAPPYWPWVQAIRAHVSSTEPQQLRSQLGSTGPVIAEVVQDIREKLPDLPEPQRIEDPESARFRLFDSVSTFLKNISGNQPLVVMLEDLHWADRPSLMLLEFIARELANSKILIVGNYRDVELNRRHPLSVTLGDLTRERLFERVVLRGLQRHDVQRFIEIAAGITPPAALVDTVHAQTEGNPLFVTETVRLLIQEGDIASGKTAASGTTSWEIRIPEGVREVIGRRLDRLSERCNELLTIAAVIGRQFRFGVLKMLVEDTTEGQLLDAMDEALDARIIEELPEEVGLYQFTHAQMQETLTLELSANRLVRMHARIAEALPSRPHARPHRRSPRSPLRRPRRRARRRTRRTLRRSRSCGWYRKAGEVFIGFSGCNTGLICL
jgi:predicted ATPase